MISTPPLPFCPDLEYLRHTQELVKSSRGRKPRKLPEGWSRRKNKTGYISMTGDYARNFAEIMKIEDTSRSVIDELKAIILEKDVELASLREKLEDVKECSVSLQSALDDFPLLITDMQYNAETTRSAMKSLTEQRDDLKVRLEESNESVNMLVRRQVDSDKILTEGKEEVGMCHSNLSWICNVPICMRVHL
jgi:chromosome segregation ATPase